MVVSFRFFLFNSKELIKLKPILPDSFLLFLSDMIFIEGTPSYPQLSMARHPIEYYTPTVKVYSIQLWTESIVSSNYVVLHLLEVKVYRSGRSKLPPGGKIGTIAAQSLLLHIIFAQVWYETGQWRKVIRFSYKSWRFSGYLNASWRSVLEFELRLLRLPVMVLNDTDIQLLHGKGIKRRHLIFSSD